MGDDEPGPQRRVDDWLRRELAEHPDLTADQLTERAVERFRGDPEAMRALTQGALSRLVSERAFAKDRTR